MLDRALRLTGIAALLGTSFGEMADRGAAGLPAELDGVEGDDLTLALATRWAQWRHTAFWIDSMRGWAAASDRLVVVGPHDQEEAGAAARGRGLAHHLDPQRRGPGAVCAAGAVRPGERMQRWRRWLVEEPQAWVEGGVPGSLGYDDTDLEVFTDPDTGAPAPVLMFVGRYTEVKRIPLLIRAYARAREHFDRVGAAGHLGRLPRRVGGRAPPHGGHGRGRRQRVLRGVARPRRAARGPGVRGRDGHALHQRVVRPGVHRGHGVPGAGHRRRGRRHVRVREHRPAPPQRLACRSRRPGQPGGRDDRGGQPPRRPRGARRQRPGPGPGGVLVDQPGRAHGRCVRRSGRGRGHVA